MTLYPPQTSQPRDSTSVLNLKRLVFVRIVAIAGEVTAIGVAVFALGMQLPVSKLGYVIVAQAAVNVIAWMRLRSSDIISANEFLFQLCVDVLILTTLLYLVGGATNPFVSLLLLPLVVAAAVLPRAHVSAMAAVVVSAYGLLMFAHQPMPHVASHAGRDFDWHVTGMWFSFLLAVIMIVFFVLRMAESLRERDQRLAQARERALRDEQLVALGTLAAGAAHELGTPLSTMAVLARELEQEYRGDEELHPRMTILRQQVDRCKETLAMISASSGQLRAEGGHRVQLDRFLAGVVEDWRKVRPDAKVAFSASGVQPAPTIVSEKGLRQALISFLDNAADSSPDTVEMECHWSDRQLQVVVSDRGPGLPLEFKEHVGKVPFSTKEEGHGLGLFLAHAIIQRLDGSVSVTERTGGGTRVTVEMELGRLLL